MCHRSQLLVGHLQCCFSHLRELKLVLELANDFVFMVNYAVFLGNLLLLVEHLSLAHLSELLS